MDLKKKQHRFAIRRLALGIVPMIAAIGCGGGGGGSASDGGGGVTVPLTTNEIQLASGQTWTYAFSGTFTPPGGTAESATGTDTYTVASRSGTTVTEDETFTFSAGGKSFTRTHTLVYDQGSDGSLKYISSQVDGDAVETVKSTTFTSPGVLGAGTSATGTTDYTDGSVETDTLNVSDSTQVTTPVAVFNAWKTSYQVVYNGTTIFNFTEDRVPGIGHPAVSTGTSVGTGGTVTGTYTLKSTNVTLP